MPYHTLWQNYEYFICVKSAMKQFSLTGPPGGSCSTSLSVYIWKRTKTQFAGVLHRWFSNGTADHIARQKKFKVIPPPQKKPKGTNGKISNKKNSQQA